MRSSAFAALLVGLVPGACRRASDAPAPTPVIQDLGLAAHALIGADDLWLVIANEAEQGGRDGNGDGDALDDLVYVLDRGRLVATGLALTSEALGPPIYACADGVAALGVSEAAQGGRDRNGDGDADDVVLAVYERASGTLANLGFALRSVVVGGGRAAFDVDEAAQGARDLDGDGDAQDGVLFVYDLASGTSENLVLADSAPLGIHGDFVALRKAESPGLDLNADGDDLDQAVFELYDARTRLIQSTGFASAGGPAVCAGGVWGIAVDEAQQGRGDLSGDGDTDDEVYFAYDPLRGLSANLGLVAALLPPPRVDGERFLLCARESESAQDWNGDGDRDDLVVHVFDAPTGILVNTGLASQGSAVLLGDWIAVSVSEALQGSSDLDGDGEAGGNVVHVFELASARTVDLGIDAFTLYGSGGRLFLAPSEESGASADWNRDGDRTDRVLFDWSAGDEAPPRPLVVVGQVVEAAAERALLATSEAERGGDGNADGDADDLLLELYDAHTDRLLALGLAVGSSAHLATSGIVALVDEAAEKRDLNGDGDELDQVLHVIELD